MAPAVRAAVCVFMPVLMATTGCGSRGPQPVPVSGVVTFEGEPCPAPGTITFTALEPLPGVPRRPGSGNFDVDGQFVVTSFKKNDGLYPGKYRVRVDCFRGSIPNRPGGFEEANCARSDFAQDIVVEPDADDLVLTIDVPWNEKAHQAILAGQR